MTNSQASSAIMRPRRSVMPHQAMAPQTAHYDKHGRESAMAGSELVNVRISRQILWIGAEAYPLRNIARAQTLKVVPNRGAALRRYLTAVLIYVLLGAAAAVAMRQSSQLGSAQGSNTVHAVGVGALALVLVLFVISTIRLAAVLSARTYYALVIETAGTPRRVLVSTEAGLVGELVRQIMKAIDDPSAEFQQPVMNYHFGDKIYQYGDFNIGKVLK